MSETTYHQIHLVGKGMSGRAVRYVTLDDEQVEKSELTAARELGKDGLMFELWARQTRIGMELMIKSVTDPVTAAELPKAAWKTVTPELLHDGWKTLFTNKDTKVLKKVYEEEHSVSADDIDAIMGKKTEVLAD